ncbi:hypothetical protein Ciccas_014331 [Cichlidogyrus casuarinus]|uniref:Uncharacterized protein n=1 Tax=Cichlidogyrus casuarinus TaxID=1844966 RepID=A0ABD2PK28_9PLAT
MSVKITTAEWNKIIERLEKLETDNKIMREENSDLKARLTDLEEKVVNSDFNLLLGVLKSTREESESFTCAQLKKADTMLYAITSATRQRIAKEDQIVIWNVKDTESATTIVNKAVEDVSKCQSSNLWRIGKKDSAKTRALVVKTGKRISNEKVQAIAKKLNELNDVSANSERKIYVNRDKVWLDRKVEKLNRESRARMAAAEQLLDLESQTQDHSKKEELVKRKQNRNSTKSGPG